MKTIITTKAFIEMREKNENKTPKHIQIRIHMRANDTFVSNIIELKYFFFISFLFSMCIHCGAFLCVHCSQFYSLMHW